MSGNIKIRILVVDDVTETREKIKRLLELESDIETVGIARTGKEAIQASLDLNPDVVLMDINMPDMDGIAATEAIRAKQPFTQVIIISVQSDINYMRRAMLVGARDFITKPPMSDELTSSIRRAWETAKIERGDPESIKLKIQSLLFEEKQLELTKFDLESRLDLYKQSITTGRLVDSIESLVAGLAHDLRSPLNIILSIIGTIKITDQALMGTLMKIWRRCIYCKWIADNFLGITLNEKPSTTRVPLKSSIDEAVSLLENRISTEVKILNNVPQEVHASIDAGLFRIVLLNLLSNSLESIVNKGTISISSQSTGGKTAIFVKDDGTPIPSNEIENLFNLGFTSKKSHCGIGLYVSKRLLQQQHGNLSFSREFNTQSKIFSYLLQDQSNFDESTITLDILTVRMAELRQYTDNLQKKLSSYRRQSISEEQQLDVAQRFREITTTFSQNLSNELLAIEAMVIEALRKIQPGNDEITGAFQKILKNCMYCRLLTRNIIELGSDTSLKLKDVALVEVIENVISLVDRKMPQHLYKIDWDVDFLLPNVQADDVQMKQVFMNLVKNAIDAMPNGGKLGIRLQQDADFVKAEISDSGIGITPENLTRLFQLGFTTKPKGYGIGLHSIKNIIDRHKGTIEVFSKINKGTTFRVRLPITQISSGG